MPQKKSLKQQQLERELRRQKVMANLLAGHTYRSIAEACDCSLTTVARDVKIVLSRLQREHEKMGDQYLLVELRRLDVAINAIWDKIQQGDLRAIDRLIALMNRRAKYLGLDSPARFTLSDDELRSEYESLLAELADIQAAKLAAGSGGAGDASAATAAQDTSADGGQGSGDTGSAAPAGDGE